MLILKLAFRNLFRNKRRTILSIIAIGVGVAGLISTDAVMKGMGKNMVNSAIKTITGHSQIHNEGFSSSFEVNKTITNREDIIKKLESDNSIKNYTERTLSIGMISSPKNSESIMVYGIDVDKERDLSIIDESIKEGKYLSKESKNGILIGKKLAKTLDIKLGDKIVLTVNRLTESTEESPLSQAMFRVEGIYSTSVDEIDKFIVMIKIDESQTLLNLNNQIHEIAMVFKNIKTATESDLKNLFNISTPNKIESWEELFPELKSMLNMTQFMILILAIILFSIVSIGIVNTLFMSIYERMFEFGVMKSIGTKPIQMFKLIVLEALLLTFLSILLGFIIGTSINYWLSIYGLNYNGVSFMDVTIVSNVYPVFNLFNQYIVYPSLLILIAFIAALYPAIYTAKLDPAVVMKK
ncbi:ABC transporter permease [bacterium]|nr:ABC transporter permease [bacterium]